MMDELISIYKNTDYDFRDYSFPGDEFSYMFNEWVDYYKMKYAIAKVIQPKSILEIGVRYGYNAITFLKASENAIYLGIYDDSDIFGRDKDLVTWASIITKNYHTDFLLANTKSITSLPGDFYDLIHIDDQQDGDQIFHNLELALEKSRWILVDGYLSSNENLLGATYFLSKYRDFLEFTLTMPSHAGELLIKVKDSAKHIFTKNADKSYSSLKDTYDSNYFLSDCGGYDSFKKFQGKKLEDPRLIAVYCLVNPHKNMKILDVGCGRGELSFTLSQSGAQVVGIDYSSSAIQIAKTTYLNSSVNKLKFIRDDFLNYEFAEKFDRITATDFIEHIEEDKLELMIKKTRNILKEEGLFIVHTHPNKLYYQHSYEEKRKIARSIDIYIPQNPRTFYEDLMHINEQTPKSLNELLSKYFPYALTWVSTPPDLAGSLSRSFSWQEYVNAQSIFCVASLKNIDKDSIISLLTQEKLDLEKINIELYSQKKSLELSKGEKFTLDVDVSNNGEESLVSLSPYPVHISYHWIKENGDYQLYDGIRTSILPFLRPNEKRQFKINMITPDIQGRYTLQLTLVQEYCFWFEEVTKRLPLSIDVIIK